MTRDVPQSTVSGPPAGQPIEPSGTKQTLKEMVDAIKQELELGGSMASVIRQANELMGLAPYSLTLPEQAEQLMSRLVACDCGSHSTVAEIGIVQFTTDTYWY